VVNPYDFQTPVRRFFRRRRFRSFRESYAHCKIIVDVGGDYALWHTIGRTGGVVILNLWAPKDHGEFPYVIANGCTLPFADKSVDLAFSNSAIEHVGSFENQSKFAAELQRVGKRLLCQTPCRLFPVDPHLAAPILHWLPKRCLTPRLLRYLTINGWLLGRPYEYDVTWLSKRQLREIFPGCQIKTERFLGLPKSFVVTR
jgi:hypothetical protein